MPSASYSPNFRVWLDLENTVVNQKANNTGQIGQYLRAGSTYCDETLLQFTAVSALAGATIDNVYLDFTLGTDTWPGAQTGYLFEQDKTIPSSWTSPVPRFDDFAGTAWATTLATVTLNSVNSATGYIFSGSNLTTLVQSWVDNSADNWGVIIGTNPSFFSYYATLTSATLRVVYTQVVSQVVPQIIYNYRRRRF